MMHDSILIPEMIMSKSEIYPQEMNTSVYKKKHMGLFMTALWVLWVIPPNWKNHM
jgi:hypothetical protein